jgi:serine/threonine protein kinase
MQVGTPVYMAPELLAQQSGSEAGYSRPVDVYSFGILVYEVLSGQVAFSERGKIAAVALQQLILEGQRPNWDRGKPVEEKWKRWVETLWEQDPEKRPTFMDICAEPDKLKFDGCDEAEFNAYKEKVLAFLKPK